MLRRMRVHDIHSTMRVVTWESCFASSSFYFRCYIHNNIMSFVCSFFPACASLFGGAKRNRPLHSVLPHRRRRRTVVRVQALHLDPVVQLLPDVRRGCLLRVSETTSIILHTQGTRLVSIACDSVVKCTFAKTWSPIVILEHLTIGGKRK